MLRVCLDTNIWLSGVVFKSGPPSELVNLAFKERIRVISSGVILDELARNLSNKFDYPGKITRRLIYEITQVVDLFEPRGEVRVARLSRADTLVLETAFQGEARYLVSGDKNILALKHFKRTRIIDATHLLRLMNR
jgi:uncharacterized protein